MDHADEDRAYEALLRWYLAMGVDGTIGESPQDRFAPAASPTPPAVSADGARQAAAPSAVPTLETSLSNADPERMAAACTDLDTLRTAWANAGCALAASAAHMLFASGAPGAKIMIVAGAPSSDDEREGVTFGGEAGRLLDSMLRAISLSRASAYLTYVVPWRPPGNRQPSAHELSQCLPFARRHIELLAPDILVCLGERAAHPLLGTRDAIQRLRGRWLAFEAQTHVVPTMVTFSLEFLLRQPLQKRHAWSDLLLLQGKAATAGLVEQPQA